MVRLHETAREKIMNSLGLPTSLPTGMPLPRAAVSPMTLAMKALRVKYSFRTTPLRMVLSSGIPEPGTVREATFVLSQRRSSKKLKSNC